MHSPSEAPEPMQGDALRLWRSTPALRSAANWEHFLEANNLTQTSFVELLSGRLPTDVSLAPLWAEAFTRAYSGNVPQKSRRPTNALSAASAIMRPVKVDAERRLKEAITRINRSSTNGKILLGVQKGLSERLEQDLLVLALRPVLLESEIANRNEEALPGANQSQSYLAGLGEPAAQAELFNLYPGLAKEAVRLSDQWVAASVEFVSRLDSDRLQICQDFGIEPGARPIRASMADSDAHHDGRRVIIADFDDGKRIVYKPRSLQAIRQFQFLVSWLNDAAVAAPIKTLQVLDRGSYGWLEHVSYESCKCDAQLDRFYERTGVLLALLNLVGASDCHFENLIACGEHPYLIDLETLLVPSTADRHNQSPEEHFQDAFARSVCSTGLLPNPSLVGNLAVDLSGLGAAPNQDTHLEAMSFEYDSVGRLQVRRRPFRTGETHNRPRFGSRLVAPHERLGSIVDGFSAAYDCLRARRAELVSVDGPLMAFNGAVVRVVVRPTAEYSAMLEQSYHPNALYNGLERDRALAQLWDGVEVSPLRRSLVASEFLQMQRGDVPYFWSTAGARTISDPSHPAALFTGSQDGLEQAKRKLSQFSTADRTFQTNLICASIASIAEGQEATALADQETGQISSIEAATAIASRLASSAVFSSAGASWFTHRRPQEPPCPTLGAAPVKLLGGDLYSGLAGVILFLAYFSSVTGQEAYEESARSGLKTLVGQLEKGALSGGPGAFNGLAGCVYLFAHLANLWPDKQELLHRAESLIPDVLLLAERIDEVDLISGKAGVLLSLLALDHVAPQGRAIEAASRIVDTIRRHIEDPPLSKRLYLRGASHGYSGVLWALAAYAKRVENVGLPELMRIAAIEESLCAGGIWTDPGDPDHRGQSTWCHGALGIALCRVAALRETANGQFRAAALEAVQAALPVLASVSPTVGLCHGHHGTLDLSIVGSATLPEAADWDLHRKRQVDEMHRLMPPQGLVGFPDPGLMNGLAGVGMQFLRVGSASFVPSVLLLEPPR